MPGFDNFGGSQPRRGLTMLELAVVLTILVLGISLLLPAIRYARSVSMDTTCINNLRQIGLVINEQVSRQATDPKYTSGAWLPDYRGSHLAKVGWVADMRRYKVPREGLLCPANRAQVSEAISIERLERAYQKGLLPPQAAPGDTASLQAFQQSLIDDGYNTNYCELWYLARTALLPMAARKGEDKHDLLDPENCVGPLSERIVKEFHSSKLMLIADGRPLGLDENGYAACVTAGPVDQNDPDGAQDFSALGLVHGAGRRRSCNVLFADGHVDTFVDINLNQKLEDSEFRERTLRFGLRRRDQR